MKTFLYALLAHVVLLGPSLASSIVAGQVIQIRILGVPPGEQARINAEYPVSDSGYVSMWPELRVKAAGMSTDSLARKIEQLYREAQIYTSPTIQIVSDSSDKLVEQLVTVGGKVRMPGPKPYQRDMTLFSAVMAAGGPTEFGAANRIELFRNTRKYIYDLSKGDHKLLKVFPNDVINVPDKNVFGR
jgi:protein involved in polysaccharide export with SLBB domain